MFVEMEKNDKKPPCRTVKAENRDEERCTEVSLSR
jgi:hypothetical protein